MCEVPDVQQKVGPKVDDICHQKTLPKIKLLGDHEFIRIRRMEYHGTIVSDFARMIRK